MNSNAVSYIIKYNKKNYKMYQFRVKKTDHELISYLDGCEKRNSFIVKLIENNINESILSIKKIKSIIKPILLKYGIKEIYIFGSYARGEANANSDVDIYCEKGDIKTLIDQEKLEEELQAGLNKKVDIIFTTSRMNDFFRKTIQEDLIKLC